MTDTGQVPGEGLPENAGMVEQPGIPAPGAYTFLDPSDPSGHSAETVIEDDDLLLMPASQGAWSDPQVVPAQAPAAHAAAPAAAPAPQFAEPSLDLAEAGAHEAGGRDSGSVDLSGVRMPSPQAPAAASMGAGTSVPAPSTAPTPPPSRRPLHMGPPVPDASGGVVRSLADRGPAAQTPVGGPGVAQQGAVQGGMPGAGPGRFPTPAATPVRHAGPPTTGPEYLDVPRDDSMIMPGPQLGEIPSQGPTPWTPQAPAPVRAAAQAGQPVAAHRMQAPQGQVPQMQAPQVQLPPQMSQVPQAQEAGQASQAGAQQVQVAQVQVAPVPAQGQSQAETHVQVQAVAESVSSQSLAHQESQESAAETVVPEQVVPERVPPEAVVSEAAVPAGGVVEEAAPAGAVAPEVVTPVAVAPDAVGAGGVAAEAAVPAGDAAEAAADVTAAAPVEGGTPSAGVPAGAVPEGAAQAGGVQPVVLMSVPASENPSPENSSGPSPVAVAPESVPAAAETPAAEPAEPVESAAVRPVFQPGPAHATPTAPVPGQGATPPQGQFVQVEGSVPDGTRLAPTPVPHVTGMPTPMQEAPAPAALGQTVAAAQVAAPAPVSAPMAPPVPAQAEEAQPQPESQAPVQPVSQAPVQAEPGVVPPAQESGSGAVRADAAASAVQPTPPGTAEVAGPVEPGAVSQETEQSAPTGEAAVMAPAAEAADEQPASGQLAEIPAEPAATVPAPRDGGTSTQPVAQQEPVADGAGTAGAAGTSGTGEAAETIETAEIIETQEQAEPGRDETVAAEADASVPGAAAAYAGTDTPAEPATVPEPVAASEVAPEPVADEQPEAPAVPAAPGYDDAEREAVLRVMRERRDIRNGFRSDPIPHEVLLRVLEAAHHAPSVGHSQPWDFVVIRSAETRRAMHELAARQRDAYAKSLPKARAKQFKELKIEAILDTPVNIVVTADPTRGGRHTLGRHTQPQMAPYSSALAVENLWLAARAEGLGVGWVSFFDEREMVRALGLPEHLEVVAYLCVGYVDEFPEEPELLQAGWSKRRPLSWVVHEETYGRRALPGEEPHDLLQETIAGIRPLDAKALGEAWERQKRMTKPAGALGMLEIISAQLSGLSRACPPPIPEPAAVAIFAGDHGVHAQGVTAWPQEVTSQMVANFLGGGAVCNAFANQVGAEVCVIDVGVAGELPATPGLLPRKVRAGTADFTTGPALSRDEVLAAIEVGIETARDLVAAGNKALLTGEMGIANTTVSAALISVYTGQDPAEITGRGTGINDEMHARKVDVVRRALDLHKPDPADPIGVLSAVGGLEHAALVGFLLGGASLRTPVILDGVSAGAAALVARAIAPEALAACISGHRSAEPGHVAALNKLGLRPLVDLDLRLGEGTGALLALPVVQCAARAMHEVATFDSAGVTEK
ncbi:nicotinate-nucleotide--dimethylbenzimidazole phosphoribosyltransferase [Streptomyces sp. NPDC051561]|uniref:nicotinate-nucleotide--dimethylbenzimidazole phosphoribosyltransferase n=1 Tax=Streptomyces sp. NPDC051561 TaxID=3365658 RepID=UPI003787FECF